MKSVSRAQQKKIWDKEHRDSATIPQLNSSDPSSAIVKFYDWLKRQAEDPSKLCGLEICCGKGRNVNWLAQQGMRMTGLDFSETAISLADKRAKELGVEGKVHFLVQDVTLPFPLEKDSVDFAIDCFGSTDIESQAARDKMLENVLGILKPGGYLLIYLLSTDDEYFKDMVSRTPGLEPGSFVHPVNGKYEKSFTEDEIKYIHPRLALRVMERIPKKVTLLGKEYAGKYIWAVLQKTT